ncbi:MAG: transcriptional regulatory protein [Frankiales bacterium]|jgi:excisionase family DNA binding protein|nr:transcriptional regulatory protein [Frankiales bacterium]
MLTQTEVAERMGIGPTGVRDLIKSGHLLSIKTDEGVRIPAGQLDGDQLVKHLVPVLTLLRDAGYTDDEALRWLTTPDDTIPGTPLQALHENRATEIKRRAQALGF